MLDPFYPEYTLYCSQRKDSVVKEKLGKAGNDKMLFICGIHGQGSNRNKIIFGCVIGAVVLMLVACIAFPCIKKCRKSRSQSVAIEY